MDNEVNKEEKQVTKNNVEFVEKKDAVINQKPKKTPKEKTSHEKVNVRNIIWIVVLFILMFGMLVALPYISNYR